MVITKDSKEARRWRVMKEGVAPRAGAWIETGMRG